MMTGKYRTYMLAAVMAAGVACGSASAAAGLPPLPEVSSGSAPLWVDDPRLQYPRTDYLSRRGRGASAEAAAQMAYDKILKLYQIEAGQPLPDELQKALEIAAIWQEEESGHYRALVTLRQKVAENYLRTRIAALDSATEEALKTADTTSEPIVKLGMTGKALQYQQERARYQSSMKRVDVTARGIAPRWQIKALEQRLDGYITALAIHPAGAASDVALDVMANMITRGLKVAGIQQAPKERADYILSGRLSLSHAPDESGWMGGQGVLELTLTQPGSEQTLGSHRWEISVIHLYPETAERRVVEKAEYLLKKEMRDVLIEMATRQQER